MRSFARPLIVTALASVAALPLACSSTKPLGGLVVAINTNVSVPKDINGLGLAVSVNGITKFSNVYGVAPDGQVTLPATLVLQEPNEPGQAVNIRVMAFSGGNIRIVRDAITTIPHQRVAVLRLQLSALSFDDGATGTINPGEVDRVSNPAAQSAGRVHLTDSTSGFDPFLQITSRCDLTKELADIDGICQDARVDSSTLPDAADVSITPTAAELASCFDVGRCFASPTAVTPDGSCSFAFAGDATQLNVALETNGAGFPTASGYLAPLDLDPAHGFSIKNGVVSLPKALCAAKTRFRRVLVSSACPSKTVEMPVASGGTTCAGSTFDAGTPPQDGGAALDAAADGGDAGPPAPTLVASATQLGMQTVAALAAYPGQSLLYVADVAGSLRLVNVGATPAVVAAAKGSFTGGSQGTALATNGPDIIVVTYPTTNTVRALTANALAAPPSFGSTTPVGTTGKVYGATFHQGLFYFASLNPNGLEYTKSPFGTMASQLSSSSLSWFDALGTDSQDTTLYGTPFESTTPSTKPGLLTVDPNVGMTVMTDATNASPVGGHTGSIVAVRDPAVMTQTSLVFTNTSNGDINVADRTAGSITTVATADIVTPDTNQPYNLATDDKGNVYFATKSSGIMKLPIFPARMMPTTVVPPAAATGARTVLYQNGQLYFTTTGTDPAKSGLMAVAVP